MRVLLEECVPRKFKSSMAGHDCLSVPEAGFAAKRNGELLDLAGKVGFEVLVTLDKGMEYEQNLRGRNIAVTILRAKSNRLVDILPLVAECLE